MHAKVFDVATMLGVLMADVNVNLDMEATPIMSVNLVSSLVNEMKSREIVGLLNEAPSSSASILFCLYEIWSPWKVGWL